MREIDTGWISTETIIEGQDGMKPIKIESWGGLG